MLVARSDTVFVLFAFKEVKEKEEEEKTNKQKCKETKKLAIKKTNKPMHIESLFVFILKTQ